jgi:hypothetical protein
MLMLLATVSTAALAASNRPEIEVKPGPEVMSEEERSLAPDPNKGMQHGVILLEEVDRQEGDPNFSQIAYHLRAKILSNEGRDLANVEFSVGRGHWRVKEWWGKTILPDGTVLDLPREGLEEHTVARVRRESYRVMKGALPGVTPGSVIDYGFTLRDDRRRRWLDRLWRVNLQRVWPIMELRYKWEPWEYLASGFVVLRARGLDVDASRYVGTVYVVGKNLPPVEEEPLMPPIETVQASVSFFYFGKDENPEGFWNSEARQVEERVASFVRSPKAMTELTAELEVSAGADLEARLRAAYEWIGRNLGVRRALEGEGIDEYRGDYGDKGRGARRTAKGVVAAGDGSEVELDLLFIAMARALGADAYLVLGTDRTEHHWNRGVVTMWQFDESVVAVLDPRGGGNELILLDPGSRLPYGLIPWWIAGSKGLMATSKGAKEINLPFSEAEQNVSETMVVVTLEEKDSLPKVRWSRTGSGNHGFLEHLMLHRSDSGDRKRLLDELCGSSADFEVTRAEEAAHEGHFARLRFECEGVAIGTDLDMGNDGFFLDLEGPWIESIPELTSRERRHSLIFDYPRIDRMSLEIVVPTGFEMAEEVDSVTINNPFGRYSLETARTPNGFRVARILELPHPALYPDRYAGFRRFLGQVRRADKVRIEFKSVPGAE